MRSIAEKDWKLLRSMVDRKLDQACGKLLGEIESTIHGKKDSGNHKAYLAVYKIVDSGDREIAKMFDNLRRSTAIMTLANWKHNGLLTTQELAEFSDQTQATIELITNHE